MRSTASRCASLPITRTRPRRSPPTTRTTFMWSNSFWQEHWSGAAGQLGAPSGHAKPAKSNSRATRVAAPPLSTERVSVSSPVVPSSASQPDQCQG
jgi:hypothetical protein